MKYIITTITFLIMAIGSIAQFGADYSSYGFNFIDDQFNEGLKNWNGNNINDINKFNLYKQDTQNNYAPELKPVNETLSISYNDSGYMDLNPCSFKINLRIKVNQYSGNNDTLNFTLFSGGKKVEIVFTQNGIYFTNNSNNLQLITPNPPSATRKTYSISLDSCTANATFMIENDTSTTFSLNFPANQAPQNINISSSTNGSSTFSSEIDHIFLCSNPIKWRIGASSTFINDTPIGYTGTTGDRQHF